MCSCCCCEGCATVPFNAVLAISITANVKDLNNFVILKVSISVLLIHLVIVAGIVLRLTLLLLVLNAGGVDPLVVDFDHYAIYRVGVSKP